MSSFSINTFELHGQKFHYTDRAIRLSKKTTEEMLQVVHDWQFAYPIEDTYAQREYNVPSIIVRLDCVLDENEKLHVYEVQEGCGWVGYSGIANPEFRKIRDEFKKNVWPDFKLLITDSDFVMDDTLWLERVDIQEALLSDYPLMNREPHRITRRSIELDSLAARSLKPIRFFNSKFYGVELGLWKRIDFGDPIPWEKGFVLKPSLGHGSQDIMIWKTDNRAGRATRTQIVNTLQQHGKMYIQPFVPPMQITIEESLYNVILRPFFGYHPQKKVWVPMHGVWTGRPYPNLRIHGASDAISGPLLLET